MMTAQYEPNTDLINYWRGRPAPLPPAFPWTRRVNHAMNIVATVLSCFLWAPGYALSVILTNRENTKILNQYHISYLQYKQNYRAWQLANHG